MQKEILFKEAETAKILGVKVGTLRYWRWKGFGPRFVKLGNLVRYDPRELEQFLADHTCKSTSEAKKWAKK